MQHDATSCGIFMLMYAFCICTGAPFLFESSEVPAIRKWWCLQLMERFSIERQGRYFGQRFAYWTEEAKLLLGGSLPPFVRLKPIREQMQVPLLLAKRGVAARRMLLELEHKVIWKILVLVVVEDGDVAIWRLALTCKAFHHIVCQLHFRREAHFCWLDSVVDWRKRAPQQYRSPYTISVCSHLMCRSLYKDCGPGYRGKGKRGVLEAFYSSEDFPGCCSWDCFICDGGLD